MKSIRFIAFALAMASTVSCAIDEFDFSISEVNSSDKIQVIGRTTKFDDYDVATRAPKQGDESKVTSYAMAIFRVNTEGDKRSVGDCVHYEYHENQSQLLFTIDRGNKYIPTAPYAIYLFANIPGLGDFSTKALEDIELDDLLSLDYTVQNLDIPEKGFPMIGSLGDTFSTIIDKGTEELILSPTEGDDPPKLGSESVSTLNIPMKALYAKINFEIEVRPDQTIEGTYAPQFELHSYKIVNVPNSVDFRNDTNADNPTKDIAVLDTIEVNVNKTASGASKINFSFYLPENLLQPATSASEYGYPFKGTYDPSIDEDQDGIRNEDERYCQRYKVKLLNENQPATNIILSGRFRDHQTHYVDVDYTIYLGKDNYSDFNIVRNSEYNNVITIRGILNSDDNDDNYISLDHRVNISYTQPAIISLRREVLLDSHFEIRPMRIKPSNLKGDDLPTHVKVEVVSPNVTKWIRLERSAGIDSEYEDKVNASGESIYITAEGPSKGKRRYFTHNLVTGVNLSTYDYPLNNSTSVVAEITDKGDCIWIYVDEVEPTIENIGDGVRSGEIKLTYGKKVGNNFVPVNNQSFPEITYTINQRKLFKVKNGVHEYLIEYEEEYLHNFDSNDSFGQTQQEGMEWGLNNIQLSYDHKAIDFGSDLSGSIQNAFTQNLRPNYDFYVQKHDSNVDGQMHDRAGYDFSLEIIQVVNGLGGHDTDDSNNINILPLNASPRSAVEYCFNKNKRYSNGQVTSGSGGNQANLVWYLPAIDEIEDIVMGEYQDADGLTQKSYARFEDFQNKFYWSSQPSYMRHYAYYWGILTGIFGGGAAYGDYYTDDTSHARATSVSYANNTYNFERSGLFEGEYFSYWRHIEFGYDNEDNTYYSGTHNPGGVSITLGIDEESRQLGNKPRTGPEGMARVRCVRKNPETN